MKKYVQYGCGLSAPEAWTNYDVSPTLKIQKTPVIGTLMSNRLSVKFPDNVKYGNIITGLPEAADSCDAVYCSHTLEHLSFEDFRKALKNTYAILKPGGTFRCIVPDLEHFGRSYIQALDSGDAEASIKFVKNTIMGTHSRPRGFKAFLKSFWGNANHLWMWDEKSLSLELEKAGFKDIRRAHYGDSDDPMFDHVENEDRFVHAVAIDCRK